jgi:malate dehydrogenase (decarboxylating)
MHAVSVPAMDIAPLLRVLTQDPQMAYNWPSERVDVIVLTDGSRVLGLGDLGVQGMGIPIGKLDLYVAGAGIHPSFVLPVCLDVGTDNAALRADSCYLGLPRPRLTGAEYYAAVDELISALRTRWPNALLQFEDFSTGHALTLLERYRYDFPTFNDDIQGTAAVVLAGVYGALAVQGFPPSAIATQRFLVCGAGSAGMGITQALLNAMVLHGLSRDEALSRFCVLDAGGVIGASRRSVDRAAAPYRTHGLEDGTQLLDAINTFKPTALLGLSTVRGLFTAEALRAMAALNARPLIFPLSNPTSRAECTCEEAALATDGRAIFGSGSPFADAVVNGRTVKANQGAFVPSCCVFACCSIMSADAACFVITQATISMCFRASAWARF